MNRADHRAPTLLIRSVVAGLISGAIASPLLAQAAEVSGTDNARERDESAELDAIVVTGSRIRRTDMEKIVPVTVLDEATIEVRNATLPADLLTSLPSVVNLPENETRLGSSGARGDNANVNLRNMGATATLILQDGRRMAINPMTAGLSQAVNVNHLPTQGIERIEVLRDGASSIYGSDAVGGVINYVLKRDFQGVEASLDYDQPEAGGGRAVQGGLTVGTGYAQGRGRFMASVDAIWRDSTDLTERAFSRSALNADRAPEPFNNLGGPFDGRSARGYWPTFRIGTATANNYFRPMNGVPSLTTAAPSRANNPEFFLDLNKFGFASPRVKRGNAFVTTEFDVSDSLTLFADFGYYQAKSTMRRQPLALNAPTSDRLMVMPADSPFNPYGSRFYDPAGLPDTDGSPRLTGTPRAISFTQMTIADLAAETVRTDADALRIVGGVRGTVGDSRWEWESSLFYNEVNGEDEASPDIRESLLLAAIGRTDEMAFNPFGYTFRVDNGAVVADQPYTNPQSVIDSFAAVFARSARSYIASADLHASGPLFSLRDADVMGAMGLEHRREDLRDVRPPFSGENPADSGLEPTNNDFLLHPPRPDVYGDRKVTSAYAEVVVPLVSDSAPLPLVRSFEISASARYEHYSDFGSTVKPKIGANWRPVPWLMLRGSYNEGFMAPSLAALYTSPRWTITAGAGDIDTYRNPYLSEGPYVMRTYFGGNPELKAQESEGRTFGFVLDVPGVTGLSVTLDYWKIARTNLLGQRSTAQISASDTALLQAYTAAQIAAGVAPDMIDTGSGGASYVGDPDVVRLALTPEDRAAFAAWNAANPGNPAAPVGRIFSRNRPFVNLSESVHKGIDFGFRYATPRQSWGRLVVSSEWSWLGRSKSVLAPANVEPTIENELYADGAAKWRGTSNIQWENGQWNAGLGIYHVGKTHDTGATTTQAVYESLGEPSYIDTIYTAGRTQYRLVIDPVTTFNLSLGYRFAGNGSGWPGDTRIRVAVANLTDAALPLASGSFGYDPSVSQSLLSGRSWGVSITSRF